jgi:hypothetical protein
MIDLAIGVLLTAGTVVLVGALWKWMRSEP